MEIYLARSNTLRFLLVAALLVAFQVGLLLSRKGLTIYVITVLGLVFFRIFTNHKVSSTLLCNILLCFENCQPLAICATR